MLSATFIKSDEVSASIFDDVNINSWYNEAVSTLYDADILPKGSNMFYPDIDAQRKDMILYLYNLDRACYKPGEVLSDEPLPFTDISEADDIYYVSAKWAYENGIVTGHPDGRLEPYGTCSREALCTMAMRYLTYRAISPRAVGDTNPFRDSMSVGSYARSFVTASRLAGFVNGDDNGNFRPQDAISRAELAQIIFKMYMSALDPVEDGAEVVKTTAGVYDSLYEGYPAYIKANYHTAYVAERAPVDLSYFDDAVFVGDSVSMSLQFYCASTRALGNATFLCAGSLSPLNAHWPISRADSKHPVYKGEKLTVEDAVAKTGAKKVYMLLGINSLSFGVDGCVNDMVLLIEKIQAKSPEAKIIIQSVTPMTSDSPIKGSKLNNTVIAQFNERMLALCQERGWYYVDIAQAVYDENKDLKRSYCSDPAAMGIHFNYEADKAWINYLITHAPEI